MLGILTGLLTYHYYNRVFVGAAGIFYVVLVPPPFLGRGPDTLGNPEALRPLTLLKGQRRPDIK